MSLLKEFHHTKIFTTNDLDMVLDLCQRTIILHEGAIMADGPTGEIFQNDDLLAACHLEKPFALQCCPGCSRVTDATKP
jgi:cobalt/nickel transport system ATP-binding protein